MPAFVVTDESRDPLVKKGGDDLLFVTDGIDGALERAQAAAGDKDVAVMGGANVIEQFINAGLVDQLRIISPMWVASCLHAVLQWPVSGARSVAAHGPASVSRRHIPDVPNKPLMTAAKQNSRRG